VSGLHFSKDPDKYYLNPAFLLKMAALVLGIIFNYTVHRRALSESVYADSANLTNRG
jgi:hypothetical protein